MATATRTRRPVAAKRAAPPRVWQLLVLDALRTWAIPGAAAAVILVAAGLSATEVVLPAPALAVAIGAALVLLLHLAEQPLLAEGAMARERAIGAAVAVVWFALCYAPFHTRLFPGAPLVADAQIGPGGKGLPLTIPADGHRTIDVLVEGRLAQAPNGAAVPVQYTLTLEDADHRVQTVSGRFEETLKTQRLGRRGQAVVRQTHGAERKIIPNATGRDLTVTAVTLEPEDAPPLALWAYAHPLPGPVVLAALAVALLAAAIAFDRRPALAATDGALTYATASVLGTAVVFWTSNAVQPDFRTLIGAGIFGGPLGFGLGALAWWIAKRVAPLPR
ncbi:MAG TPA: hypothetical protein VKW76_10715 [Candidatus Binatia bacterium]|nr:hypothetical protein [Candidatus Binatia bacterium]